MATHHRNATPFPLPHSVSTWCRHYGCTHPLVHRPHHRPSSDRCSPQPLWLDFMASQLHYVLKVMLARAPCPHAERGGEIATTIRQDVVKAWENGEKGDVGDIGEGFLSPTSPSAVPSRGEQEERYNGGRLLKPPPSSTLLRSLLQGCLFLSCMHFT